MVGRKRCRSIRRRALALTMRHRVCGAALPRRSPSTTAPRPNAGVDEQHMNEPPEWDALADPAPQVRTAFDPECLAAHEAMTRSRVLGALRLAPSLTQPRTVDLNQDVLEIVFGSFGPDHAFHSFTPDWGIELSEPQATRGLAYLLGRGSGKLRAARIRAFLEALKVPNLPDDGILERAKVLAEQDRIDLEIRFPAAPNDRLRVVIVEAKFRHQLTEGQLRSYRNARLNDAFVPEPDCRIVGLTPEAGRGRRGRQIHQWPVLPWRDVWLQFEKRRPRETDAQLATFMSWLWHRIGALNPEPRR